MQCYCIFKARLQKDMNLLFTTQKNQLELTTMDTTMVSICIVVTLYLSVVTARPEESAFLLTGVEENSKEVPLEQPEVVVVKHHDTTHKHHRHSHDYITKSEIIQLLIAAMNNKQKESEEEKRTIEYEMPVFSEGDIMLKKPLVITSLPESFRILGRMIARLFS